MTSVAALWAPMAGGAQSISGWTAICEEPTGEGVKYGDLKALDGSPIIRPGAGFKDTEDSFSNINPVFMYQGGDFETITVIWGGTKPDAVSPKFFDKPQAEQAYIISASSVRVSTVSIYPNETWMTTHLPKAGVAFATRHERWQGFGEGSYEASAITFPMECEYSRLN